MSPFSPEPFSPDPFSLSPFSLDPFSLIPFSLDPSSDTAKTSFPDLFKAFEDFPIVESLDS